MVGRVRARFNQKHALTPNVNEGFRLANDSKFSQRWKKKVPNKPKISHTTDRADFTLPNLMVLSDFFIKDLNNCVIICQAVSVTRHYFIQFNVEREFKAMFTFYRDGLTFVHHSN